MAGCRAPQNSETRGGPSMSIARPAALSVLAVIAASLVVVTFRDNGGPEPSTRSTSTPPSFATSSGPVTLVGAGNIARCDRTGDDQTASLLDGIPGSVFAAGDNAFDKGTLSQYNNCYGPTWGRQKARTAPTPGDWDYKTAGRRGIS